MLRAIGISFNLVFLTYCRLYLNYYLMGNFPFLIVPLGHNISL